MELAKILDEASDATLSEHIVSTFVEIEHSFYVKSWKTSELDAGHFVEAIRRFLELKLFGQYTPINKSLGDFNDKIMASYLNAPGDDSYRIHIPRALMTIYGIRNKRGVGHISHIKPNRIDATLVLSSVKWILAEIIRLNSNIPIDETEVLIDAVIERRVEGIWNIGDIKRILIGGLDIEQKIIILLFNSESITDKDLHRIIENKNFSYLKKKLSSLHASRLIEYKSDGTCILSPK